MERTRNGEMRYFWSQFFNHHFSTEGIDFTAHRFETSDPEKIDYLVGHKEFGRRFWECTVDGIRLDAKGELVYEDEVIFLPMPDGTVRHRELSWLADLVWRLETSEQATEHPTERRVLSGKQLRELMGRLGLPAVKMARLLDVAVQEIERGVKAPRLSKKLRHALEEKEATLDELERSQGSDERSAELVG